MSTNKNLHSKTELTEFVRDFEDAKDNVLSKLVNKIYESCNNPLNFTDESASQPQKPISKEPASSPTSSIKSEPIAQVAEPSNSNPENYDKFDDNSSMNSMGEYNVDTSLGRTPSNVLKRISNLIAFKDNSLENYKDTDFKKLWMPDSKSRECYDCEVKFNTFRRKHHCRLCGQIFCSRCCNQNIPGKILNVAGELRVCNYCSKVILTYLKSSDINADLKSDLQSLEENLSSKFNFAVSSSTLSAKPEEFESPIKRKVSLGYQEERLMSNPISTLSNADRRNILQQSNTLKSLYEDMAKTFKYQARGMDFVNSLINSQKVSTKQQAVEVLSAMLEAGFIVSTYNEPNVGDQLDSVTTTNFNENSYYRLENVDFIPSSASTTTERSFMNDSVSALDLNNSELPQYFPKESGDTDIQNTIFSTTAAKPFLEAYCDHEEQLMSQLLQKESLDISWSKVLMNLCARIAHTIQPNADFMDIRHYVKVKKISGGTRAECRIINGVAFSKNVVHKDMKTCIDNAKILLIQCPISYQRVEGKFVTLDTLILQEKEYLRNVVARIQSYSPDIVLVHKNVSGIAQDMLRDSGITLVLDVKMTVFEKLSYCLSCDIVTSVDANIGKPKLGLCKRFSTKNFIDATGCSKTLMFLDIPNSQRGCSLILRGGNDAELMKVKKVAKFLLFARYNFRLELCYLMDIFAQPAKIRDCIFPSPISELSEKKQCSPKIDMSDKQGKEVTQKKIVSENIVDFSDPLRSQEAVDESYNPEVSVQDVKDNSFRVNLRSTILSMSPFITYSPPYLETEAGMKCFLRSFFPSDLFDVHHKIVRTESHNSSDNVFSDPKSSTLNEATTHEFLKFHITQTVDSKEVQTLIADFRRQGGKYPKKKIMEKVSKPTKSDSANEANLNQNKVNPKDVFDIFNHQRLPVLFCSFYYDTNHVPTSFCAEPLMLFMNFYGQDDIMLGLFLERYCFRSSYICSSCKLPMLNHVRKYTHSQGIVTVKISEDQIKNENSKIKMTSRCKICNTMTPKVNMNNETWCYSFAKFLELKFQGHSYTRNIDSSQTSKTPCKHSMHRDHTQYFSSNGLIVSFSYSTADIFEIVFPSSKIHLKVPALEEKKFLEERIKNFSVKGYEVYAKIHEKLANLSTEVESPLIASLKKALHKNQLFFKRRVEVVYTLLSTYSHDMSSFEINDAILLAQKELADSIELWGPKLNEAEIQSKLPQKHESSPHLDDFDVKVDQIDVDIDTPTKSSSDDNQNDKKEKITIKKLLTSLLPSNSDQNSLPSPFSSQEHFLPPGQFPILVNESDVSSMIAYALMSHDYKKKVEVMFNEQNVMEENTPKSSQTQKKSTPRESIRSESDDKDSKDSSFEKKKVTSNHVEVTVQDAGTQLTCKIYFATQFDELRSKCLEAPKNESSNNSPSFSRKCDEVRQYFARSLSQSKRWDARGGKSGSKFNKTVDDRFILKEMSKHDIGEFEKFASNYFEYIDESIQKNHLTLLAKIFGVFKIIIKKKDAVIEKSVLVIENLFSDKKIKNKYDLKGSERNRLVQSSSDDEETVLLDENFVKASWNNPLYILSHSRTILKDVIYRDASFLESNHVMDYSLLVGVDGNFLIIGIIDYIRKFTLDKKIESYLKQVVDSQRLPTVVNPSVYKNRFMDAMSRYFLTIPDRWEGLFDI